MFSYFPVVGNAVYVKSWNKVAIALDVTTGKELWDTSVLVTAPATPPTAANGVLRISGGRGFGRLTAITCSSGAQLWMHEAPGAAIG